VHAPAQPAPAGCVLITARSFGDGDQDLIAELRTAGIEVLRAPADHELSALLDALSRADGWIAGAGAITDAHLAAAPRLRIVARYGVGVDAVDLAAAERRGVVVTNTPGANTEAVADHTVGLALAVLRHIPSGDRRVRIGDWSVDVGRELGSLTVGIIGLGRIGTALTRRLQGFGCPILAYDPMLDDAEVRERGAEPASLDRLTAVSDVVSLNAPGGQTIVTDEWLSTTKTGVVLVNAARADLVDEMALAAALRTGQVSAYAADLLATKFSATPSPLLAADLADRVVITPYLAAQTVEAIDRMGSTALRDVMAVLEGRAPVHPITSQR